MKIIVKGVVWQIDCGNLSVDKALEYKNKVRDKLRK